MSAQHPPMRLTSIASCTSTQDVVCELLDADPDIVHVVRTNAQSAGLGRMGRAWENPPGRALLCSIGTRTGYGAGLLDGLVRRVVDELCAELTSTFALPPRALVWSAPNDLVAGSSGAKVAGVLIDARSVGDVVEELRIGVGVNLAGGVWRTARDARAVTTVEAIAECELALDDALLDRLATSLAVRVVRQLTQR